jgi:hypothetical protein
MDQERTATMTEEEWLKCTDPQAILRFLRGKTSDRKLRLFAVACHKRVWHLLSDKHDCRKTIEFAERLADGLASTNELHGHAWGKQESVSWVVLYKAWDAAENALDFGAGTAREAVLRMDPEKCKERENAFNAAWVNHRLGEAMRIADAAMPIEWVAKGKSAWTEERASQCKVLREVFGNPFRSPAIDSAWLAWNGGTVPKIAQPIYDDWAFDRLPVLADALEGAGCTDADLLGHCRGSGPHVRGCWAVDLVLGRE